MAFEWQGNNYTIESRSFTGLKNVLLQNGKERGELEMEWKSSCTLRLEDWTGMTKHFTFKKKSTFGRNYLLADFQLQPILEISPKWNWKSFRLEYTVEVFDLSDTEAKELELMPLICCVFWCTRQLLRSKTIDFGNSDQNLVNLKFGLSLVVHLFVASNKIGLSNN